MDQARGVKNRRRALGVVGIGAAITVTLSLLVIESSSGPASAAPPEYSSLVPARLLDSRPDGNTVDGSFAKIGVRTAGSITQLMVISRGGVAANATTVVLNVTVTEAVGPGFVTAYPCGSTRPLASNLNFTTGSTVANAVIVQVGTGGTVCLFASNETHLIADANGYYLASASYRSVVPARLLDSRPDGETVDGGLAKIGARTAGTATEVVVRGRGGVAPDATTVVLNVTVTEPVGPGFVTVYPCDSPRPLASNLNFAVGTTIANAVIVKIGANGTVCLFTSNGTQLIADVNGYHLPASSYRALVPARLLDSRPDGETTDGVSAKLGLRSAGTTTELTVAGRGGVAADATTVVLNVTSTDAIGNGFVTVYPCGTAQPLASSLNFSDGVTIPNAVIVKVGDGGKVCLFASNGTHLIADVSGFDAPTGGVTTTTSTTTVSSGPCTIQGVIVVTVVSGGECAALVALYTSTNGPSWTRKNNWNVAVDPCLWYGLTCVGGKLTLLQLGTNNLVGPVPASISNLVNLTDLNLAFNTLSGAIPASIGLMTNLQNLYLSSNSLTGVVPDALGALSQLIRLYLNTNQLTGLIPTTVGNLAQLQELYLYNNDLDGGLPSSLGGLSKLQVLQLTGNNLTGSIPASYGNLIKLESLYLYGNAMGGDITAAMNGLKANATMLVRVELTPNGCFTVTDLPLRTWLDTFFPTWNDGCPP